MADLAFLAVSNYSWDH